MVYCSSWSIHVGRFISRLQRSHFLRKGRVWNTNSQRRSISAEDSTLSASTGSTSNSASRIFTTTNLSSRPLVIRSHTCRRICLWRSVPRNIDLQCSASCFFSFCTAIRNKHFSIFIGKSRLNDFTFSWNSWRFVYFLSRWSRSSWITSSALSTFVPNCLARFFTPASLHRIAAKACLTSATLFGPRSTHQTAVFIVAKTKVKRLKSACN